MSLTPREGNNEPFITKEVFPSKKVIPTLLNPNL